MPMRSADIQRQPSDWFKPSEAIVDRLDSVGTALSSGAPQALETAICCISVPSMASGATGQRFRLLSEIAALDLSLGRLFEGHCDALQIMREAGLSARDGTYGVWAAATPALSACPTEEGWVLKGTKPYCSGAGYLDHALVSATSGDADGLFEIDSGPHLRVQAGTWPSIGMAASESYSLEFDSVAVVRAVGVPGFYTARAGFWQGSLNVAACWFGGALGLARGVLPRMAGTDAAHSWAAFGQLCSEIEAMQAALDAAASATDLDPLDATGRAQERAFSVRHQVYRGAHRVMELAGQIGGTDEFTHNGSQSRRMADLPIYLRQFHPGQDEEWLGRMNFERYLNG